MSEVINVSDDFNITIEIKVFDEQTDNFLTSYNNLILKDETVSLIMNDVDEHLSIGTCEHALLRSEVLNLKEKDDDSNN
tara:strand:- start:429 stop:665 length:237 start_codon:yes stop_codon:yes gene_type:complete